MIVFLLLLCLMKASLGFPMLHLMQMFNLLERVPEQTQRNPHLFAAPAQFVQLHGRQLRYMQPYQMIPIMFAQMRQQALLSGSDSEENILSGVIMMPVDAGLDGNAATIHHAGVIIDNSILQGQSGLNPAGQHGVSTANQNKNLPELPWVMPTTQNNVSLPDIVKENFKEPLPTITPHIDIETAPEPTMPMGRDSELTVNANTMGVENWILCNSYVPDIHELHDLVRGDGYIAVKTPEYFTSGQGNKNFK
ncbi:hypothetical protein XELAEV_18005815mg [Xenopus laevis]|nr:hypothetical protein XELAEV_18005815mg [Xenopus laevis]